MMRSCPLSKKNTQSGPLGGVGYGQTRRHTLQEERETGINFGFEFLSSMIDELLTEVLIRVPIKKVCKYKAVCKRWCRLISSSYFIKRLITHRSELHSRVNPSSFTIIFQYEAQCPAPPGFLDYSHPIEPISNHPMLSKSYRKKCIDLNFLPKFRLDTDWPIRVVASCHDLVLCSHYGRFYVTNLLTRQWITFPSAPLHEHYTNPKNPLGGLISSKTGFLCYHDLNDISHGDGLLRFRLVRIPVVSRNLFPEFGHRFNMSIPPEVHSSQFKIKIFCSESKQWTEVIVDWYPLSLNAYLAFTPILSHNGKLHWLNGVSLVSLDPFSFRGAPDAHLTPINVIKLPKELVRQIPVGFGVCQGCLCVAQRIKEETIGLLLLVWKLEDYDKGVWQLAHRVPLEKSALKKYRATFKLMAFHPYNRDVIFVEVIGLFYWFNMRTRRLVRCRKPRLDKGCRYRSLEATVPPLLHQWFPTSVRSSRPAESSFIA